jgi:hypothetical protein
MIERDDDDDDFEFTKAERVKLKALHEQLGKKYDEIAALIARQLGLGDDPNALSDDARDQVCERADAEIERWDEKDVVAAGHPKIWRSEGIKPELVTPLFHLLREHHELAEKILNIRDRATERYLRERGEL